MDDAGLSRVAAPWVEQSCNPVWRLPAVGTVPVCLRSPLCFHIINCVLIIVIRRRVA